MSLNTSGEAKTSENAAAAGLRRPALPIAAALILGVFAHHLLPIHPLLWVGVLIILVASTLLLYSRAIVSSCLLLVAFAVAGVALAQCERFFYPTNHISEFATEVPRLAQMELHLDYAPRVLTWPFGQYRAVPPKQVATATVLRIKTWHGWVDCTGQVLVQIAQPHPRLAQGQEVRVLAQLERPGPAMNPGQFNWAGYYREQRILASVQVSEAGNISILRDAYVPGFISWLREESRRLLARGFAANDLLDHALLRALVLGDSDPELRDVQEQFRRTGTSHHLAISGMHVAVLGGVVLLLCRLLRIGPRLACWISLIFVTVYGIIALPSPPVVRSVLLCLAFGIGMLKHRWTDPVQLLSISVIAMLIYHPLDLYNAGFQLSFGTVLGLMIFTRPLLGLFPARDIDEQIAFAAQRPGRFSIMAAKLKHVAQSTLAASLVAWVVSMPLIAYHFEQLNPWAIAASIILGPIVFAALIGGFSKLLLTLMFPGLSSTWAAIAVYPIAGMRHMLDWLATFPGAEVPIPSPPVWMVVLFYVLLLSLVVPFKLRFIRWSMRVIAVAGCVCLAILPLQRRFSSVYAHAGDLKITLLAVGAGQCAIIEPPDADAVAIDAGAAHMSDVLRKVIGPFLRHEGRRDVQSIFISHPNYDHFSAVAEMSAAYGVQQVYVSPQFRKQSIDNAPAEGMLRLLDQMDRPPIEIEAGRTFDLGGGAKIEVLWPPQVASFDANNTSLVVRLNFAGRSVLFPGDLAAAGERALLQSPQLLPADVLVAPHHGSSETTTSAFVSAVHPKFIVCSNDRTLSMKQHDFDRMTRNYPVYRTHLSGAITIRISRQGEVSIEPYLVAAK